MKYSLYCMPTKYTVLTEQLKRLLSQKLFQGLREILCYFVAPRPMLSHKLQAENGKLFA